MNKKQRENIREKRVKKMIHNMINQKLMKEIRDKIRNYLKGWKPKKGDDDDIVDTDTDRETNEEE